MKQIKITCDDLATELMLSTSVYYTVALEGEKLFLIIGKKGNRVAIPKDKCIVSD